MKTVSIVPDAEALASIASAAGESSFVAEAQALLKIAHAIEGMTRERACAVLCAAAAQLGHYEEAIRFARGALEAKMEAQIAAATERRGKRT